ncbi:hypothetical protein [Bordetella tumulicola]|uniref:hypothetical protein n=1 Tax=Bordetella tumulicola TaxID=1649133 RepID=UPI0039EF6688
MNMAIGSSGASGVSDIKTDSLDPQTRLMAICYALLGLLDERMSSQMEAMTARNNNAGKLKDVLAGVNGAVGKFAADAKPDTTIAKGLPDADVDSLPDLLTQAGMPELAQKVRDRTATKGELETAASKVTGQLDSGTAIAQLEMFTLQSTFGKRTQFFELMSNTTKKEQDNKSAIISNTR